jgi:hypothetical protein
MATAMTNKVLDNGAPIHGLGRQDDAGDRGGVRNNGIDLEMGKRGRTVSSELINDEGPHNDKDICDIGEFKRLDDVTCADLRVLEV